MLSRLVALVTALFTLLGSLGTIFAKDEITPVFGETAVREKTNYDEGKLNVKSFDIVVSPSGDDKNPGTEAAPLRTPAAAKEMAKQLKTADCGTVTVWFREGVYTLDETLAFTKDDCFDVIYRSYPGEKVSFTGSREFTGWTETTVNGVRAFVTDAPVQSDDDYFNALYNGDTRLSRPVYPKSGEFSVADVHAEDAVYKDNSLFNLHGAFYAKPADLMSFHNITDVDVRILHYWKDELLPVASLDTVSGRIETSKLASMNISVGDRFFFENVFEALTEPGEWYLDRTEGKLWYIPFAGELCESTVLNAGVLEQLVTVDGCSGIRFQGIEFRDSAWDIPNGEHFSYNGINSDFPLYQNIKYGPDFPQACYDTPACVTVSDSEGIDFTDCSFKNIGASGLMFSYRSVACSARACLFDGIGGNAVYIKGENNVSDTSAQTKGITVTDCRIKTYGRVFNNAIGVLLIHARECEISNNEISDGFYTAISSGWVWGYAENVTDYITIKDNLIYDIGQGWLADMGGIYCLGVQKHSVITGNVIHDVGCYSGNSGYGGWGIYLDEGSSGILVEKNIAYKCSSQGFHQHYGEDNMVRNNIFALNGDGQMRVSRKEDHNSIFFYNNILLGDSQPMYAVVEKGKFKDSGNIYWDYTYGEKVFSGDTHSPKNGKSRTDMKVLGYYNDAVFVNPYFKDAENGDFTMALNSPAKGTGFVMWDYSRAGTLTRFDV